MSVDVLIRNVRVPAEGNRVHSVDIAIDEGRIVAVGAGLALDGAEIDAHDRLAIPGLVDTHVHLDKAYVGADPGAAGLSGAIASLSRAKSEFTVEDVERRASLALRSCILQGTTKLRTHVELDPIVGMRGFEGVLRASRAQGQAIDVQVCVFAQQGLTDSPETHDLIVEGLELGAPVVGGAPYADIDPTGQVDVIFELARRFDVDVDFHLDLAESTASMQIDYVSRKAVELGWEGRVTVGHVTSLALLEPDDLERVARQLLDSGVAVTTLPSTDLFLMGREATHAKPRGVAPVDFLMSRGVTCSVATNNLINAFTPYGDGSLVRMANLYANVDHVADEDRLAACLSMVTDSAARVMRQTDYGFTVGAPGDVVILDADSPADAISRIASPLWGMRAGRVTFERPAARMV